MTDSPEITAMKDFFTLLTEHQSNLDSVFKYDECRAMVEVICHGLMELEALRQAQAHWQEHYDKWYELVVKYRELTEQMLKDRADEGEEWKRG